MISHRRIMFGYFWCSLVAVLYAVVPERRFDRILSSTTTTPLGRFVGYCVDRAIGYWG
jgi:hypothetical protein